MVGLPDGEKNFEDMYNRLHTIPACDGQTDGRTDILPWHSPRYAYASRGKKKLTCIIYTAVCVGAKLQKAIKLDAFKFNLVTFSYAKY